MEKVEFLNAISQVLRLVPDEAIGLPAFCGLQEDERSFCDDVLREVEDYIGLPAAQSDYYTSSRERFLIVVALARRHLKQGATILDIGNAPGFLALALHISGFNVIGVNLSDNWLATYPNPQMAELFSVRSCDIEQRELPFGDGEVDAVLFTEVLEHIAIKHPKDILPEFRRVLKSGGHVLFSTPNVCNVSNVIALMTGLNVFWPTNLFFGSTDRHNREFTPREVSDVFSSCGFKAVDFFGENDHANWRTGTQEYVYSYMSQCDISHAMLRNTIFGVFVNE